MSREGVKVQVLDYMSPERVAFLSAETRDEVLQQMVNLISNTGILHDKEAFHQAIMDREKIVSTGIGMGIALPHAKLANYDHFFITIGILKKPVDWQSLDGSPVRIVFMIGGPNDKQTEYLQLLSRLTQALKDEDRRKKLLKFDNPKAIVELFRAI